jgi:hypothetical protein
LVWRVFDGQKGKAEPESGANACGCGSGDGTAAGGMMGRAEDDDRMGRDGGGGGSKDNVLPPLGDLAFGDDEAFADADESHLQHQPQSQPNRRRGLSFVDKLDDALSRPLPQRHRAPPRPSMDLIPQQLVEIDSSREDAGDSTPVSRGRSRRMRRTQQPAPSPPSIPPQHMDEVVRDMNAKSGISRVAAPEAKVVYPNADATYGAEPTAQEPQANSIMLSAEQRIMLAHRASTGQGM